MFFILEVDLGCILKEFKELFTPKDVTTWVSKNYSGLELESFDLNKQPPLSPLSFYTGSMSGKINTLLRRGILSDNFSHFEGLQYDLCNKTLPDSISLWRYISPKEMFLLWTSTVLGRTYTNPTFVSITLLRGSFSGQARSNPIVIRINAPKGAPGMYITELDGAVIAEYEVLFAHHLTFKRTGMLTYEILPELPLERYRGEYVSDDNFYQF